MSAEKPPYPAGDRGALAIEVLRKVSQEHRARGDVLAFRIIDRAIVRVARELAGRTDPGRRDDGQDDLPSLSPPP